MITLPSTSRPWAMLLCYLGVLILVGSSARAAARYRFDGWNTDSGLPQNTVTSILQTHDGYLWFTTRDGLVRFDGIRFTVFNKGNTPGINSTQLVVLSEVRSGNLWAGTQNGGLTRYREGKFFTYNTQQGLLDERVIWVQEDDAGHVLVSTA